MVRMLVKLATSSRVGSPLRKSNAGNDRLQAGIDQVDIGPNSANPGGPRFNSGHVAAGFDDEIDPYSNTSLQD